MFSVLLGSANGLVYVFVIMNAILLFCDISLRHTYQVSSLCYVIEGKLLSLLIIKDINRYGCIYVHKTNNLIPRIRL